MDDSGGWLTEAEYTILWIYKGAPVKISIYNRVRYVGRENQHDGLSVGDIGYVIEDHCDGNYDVEFSNADGTTRVQAVIQDRDLELAEVQD